MKLLYPIQILFCLGQSVGRIHMHTIDERLLSQLCARYPGLADSLELTVSADAPGAMFVSDGVDSQLACRSR